MVTAAPAATAINTTIGATAVHVADDDTFSVTVRCHDANGELYYVAITRSAVKVSAYEVDAILAAVEDWSDAVPALA